MDRQMQLVSIVLSGSQQAERVGVLALCCLTLQRSIFNHTTHLHQTATPNRKALFVQDPERQKECEELLGPIGDDKFTYLKDVGRLITDYSQPDDEPGVPGDALDDDIGVAVEFEGDEDAEEDSEVDEVEVSLAACLAI